jgi:hypothetical protein
MLPTRLTMACVAFLQGGLGAVWLANSRGVAPAVLGLSYLIGSLLGAASVHSPAGLLPRLVALAHAVLAVVALCILYGNGHPGADATEARAVVAAPVCMALLALWLCVCPRRLTQHR